MISSNSQGDFHAIKFHWFNIILSICILNLAAIPRPAVFQVSLRFHSNFESSCDLNDFTAISMQINFSNIISFKVASYLACYLTNGDYKSYLLTRENKVTSAMRKLKCFQFYWNSGSCILILQNSSMSAFSIFYVYQKLGMHAWMQHGNLSGRFY